MAGYTDIFINMKQQGEVIVNNQKFLVLKEDSASFDSTLVFKKAN